MRKRKHKHKTKKTWLWEFSKKLVVTCSLLYIISFFYACIEQASDILRTCVFGYFAKAGIENVFKIKNGSQDNDGVF